MRDTMVKDEIGKPLRLTARCDDCEIPSWGKRHDPQAKRRTANFQDSLGSRMVTKICLKYC